MGILDTIKGAFTGEDGTAVKGGSILAVVGLIIGALMGGLPGAIAGLLGGGLLGGGLGKFTNLFGKHDDGVSPKGPYVEQTPQYSRVPTRQPELEVVAPNTPGVAKHSHGRH